MENNLRQLVIGAWMLISFDQKSKDGKVSYPLGRAARGSLYYLPDGHVCVNIMQSSRNITVDPSLMKGDALKYNELGYLAYSGQYHIEEDPQLMIHVPDVSLYPEWIGSQQIRKIHLVGNYLQLSSNGPVGPDESRFRLTWVRCNLKCPRDL